MTSLGALTACAGSAAPGSSHSGSQGTPGETGASAPGGGTPEASGGATGATGASGSTGSSPGAAGGTSGSGGTGAKGTGGSPPPGPNPAPVTASGQWVLGYYVGYNAGSYPLSQVDWSGLSHIVYSPLNVRMNGAAYAGLNFSFDQYPDDTSGKAGATQLSKAAHANGKKAIIMLGGSGSGTNLAIAAGATYRDKFVSDLLDAVTSLGFDGLDIDWEDHISYPDFIALAKALRASPKAPPGLILTVPGGVVYPNINATVDPQIVTLATYLDRFNLMSYGAWIMAGVGQGWCSWHSSALTGEFNTANANGCVAPVSIDQSLKAYVKAGIPKGKLGMGVAFSAMCYTGGSITAPGQNTPSSGFGGGDNSYPFSAFFAGGSTFALAATAAQKRDTSAQVPYLSLTQPVNDGRCGGSTQYISYEDETSLIAKGTYSKNNGYGGVIVWTIDQGWLPTGAAGGRAPNALMQALKKGFLDP